jgi:hypothetical protein
VKLGSITLVGDYPIRQVLCKKFFDWMALWELDSELVGSLWPMASATWSVSLSLKASMMA